MNPDVRIIGPAPRKSRKKPAIVYAAVFLAIFLSYNLLVGSPHGLFKGSNAVVEVSSIPDDASIYVGGLENMLGKTNRIINLEPGKYTLIVKKEGYHTYLQMLSLKAGQATKVEAHLVAIRPPTTTSTSSTTTSTSTTSTSTSATLKERFVFEMEGFRSDGDEDIHVVSAGDGLTFNSAVLRELYAAGDLNAPNEYFTVSVAGQPIKDRYATGMQDCTYHLVGSDINVTDLVLGTSNFSVKAVLSSGTDSGYSCPDSPIKIKYVFELDYGGIRQPDPEADDVSKPPSTSTTTSTQTSTTSTVFQRQTNLTASPGLCEEGEYEIVMHFENGERQIRQTVKAPSGRVFSTGRVKRILASGNMGSPTIEYFLAYVGSNRLGGRYSTNKRDCRYHEVGSEIYIGYLVNRAREFEIVVVPQGSILRDKVCDGRSLSVVWCIRLSTTPEYD